MYYGAPKGTRRWKKNTGEYGRNVYLNAIFTNECKVSVGQDNFCEQRWSAKGLGENVKTLKHNFPSHLIFFTITMSL